MKKKDIGLIVGAILVIVIAIFATSSTKAEAIELPLTLSGEETGLIKVDYSAYKSKVENNENFIIVIERTGCSYCEMYMPVLEDVTKELSIPVYYIDTAELSEEDYNELNNTNKYLKRNRWGTPTTLLMSGNNVVDSLGGYVEKDSFVKELVNENIKIEQEENTDVE